MICQITHLEGCPGFIEHKCALKLKLNLEWMSEQEEGCPYMAFDFKFAFHCLEKQHIQYKKIR